MVVDFDKNQTLYARWSKIEQEENSAKQEEDSTKPKDNPTKQEEDSAKPEENLTISRVILNKPVKLSGKKVKFKWKKVSGAKGYQVIYANNSKFKKATKKTTIKTTLTMKKLKKGKTYYVKVRAYNLDSAGNKVYGKYSEVRKVTMK